MTSIRDLIKRTNKAKEKALDTELEPIGNGIVDFFLALIRVILFISLSASYLFSALILIVYLYEILRDYIFYRHLFDMEDMILGLIYTIAYSFILKRKYYQKLIDKINLIRR